MALTSAQIDQVHAAFMRTGLFPGGSLKDEIREGIAGIDGGLDSQATQLNNSFPQPFRGDATTAQKNFVLSLVAIRRAMAEAGVGTAIVKKAMDEIFREAS